MYHYVDNTVGASGNGSSWSQAWNSFSDINWSAVRPGDTIYISGGSDSQTYNETLTVGASGSAAGSITITKGTDPGHDGDVIIDGGNSRYNGVELYDRDYVTVSDLNVQNIANAGFSVKYASAGVVLENNSVYSGNPGGGNARGYDVRNSVGDDAVIVRGNSYSTPANTQAQTDGIYSMDNDGVVFENNHIVISNNSDYGHSDGFQSYQDKNVTVRNNWFEQANNAVYNNHGAWMENTRTGGTIEFYDNVVLAPNLTGDAAVAHYMRAGWTDTGHADIVNNTIVGGSRSVYLDDSPGSHVYNNIVQTTAGGQAAWILGDAPPDGNIDHNLMWSPSGSTTFKMSDGNYSWSQWQGEGYEANGVSADPKFTNVGAKNFTLAAGSPAIDGGMTVSDVKTDYTGAPRQGAYDIGAYETQSSAAPTPAPTPEPTPTPTPAPTPPAEAGGTTIGSGVDKLVLRISQDAWQGDAQYTISVDGKQVGGTLTAKALHSLGQSDTVTVQGDWAPGDHQVSVNFLNDGSGGTAQTDRNLYLDSASYNGTALPDAKLNFYWSGAQDFAFQDTQAAPDASSPAPAPAPSPAPTPSTETDGTTIGTGPDKLVLRVSEDAWRGDAQFTISVDGKQIGGTLTTTASHARGESDTIIVQGDWAAGDHEVSVDFLNDASGRRAGADRNLYVEGASYNGTDVEGAALDLYWAGPQEFTIHDTGANSLNQSDLLFA